MADWVAISSLATAGGTLALAVTTYASVRSANRAARTAERSLLEGLRPLLVESRPEDPVQRVRFFDLPGVAAPGGGAAVEVVDGRLYIVFSLRNVGPGICVLHGGSVSPERLGARVDHAPLEEFRLLSRDIYLPSGALGFWQTAFRDEADPQLPALLEAIDAGLFSAELLYGDYEGGQRVITRFGVARADDGAWQLTTLRHMQVDRSDPR